MGIKGIALFGLGTGGVALSAYAGMKVMNSAPSAITLTDLGSNHDFAYTGKFGGVESNRKHLVANLPENRAWWDWAYKNRIKGNDKLDEYFKGITVGFKEKDEESLANKCDYLYARTKTEIVEEKAKDIVKVCFRVTSDDLNWESLR